MISQLKIPPRTDETRPLVLVVDDCEDMAGFTGCVPKQAGFFVCTAHCGAEVLALLDRVRPDIVVIDYWMPGMNGPELGRAIRALPGLHSMPILMLTVSRNADHIGDAFAAGVDDYLHKPIDPQILVRRLSTTLDARIDHERAWQTELLSQEREVLSQEREALQASLDEAGRIHHSQFPTLPTVWRGWHLTGAVLPCEHVGGDLFDIVDVGGQRRIVALIDISGHGIPAALVAEWVMTPENVKWRIANLVANASARESDDASALILEYRGEH